MLISLIIAVVLLVVDLVSKGLVCAWTATNGRMEIIRGVISFTYSENKGASFGIFGDHPVLLLVMTTVFTIGLIAFCVIKRKNLKLLASISLWMIVSGAIGNLYDRFAFGYVRDFIDYEFISAIIGRDFAICNFADLVLIVGTVMLMVYVVFYYGKDETEKSKNADNTAVAAPADAPKAQTSNNEVTVSSDSAKHENIKDAPDKTEDFVTKDDAAQNEEQ